MALQRGKSCLANLGIYGRVSGLVDKGRETGVLCCDFFKAFETVPQKIFVAKLEVYGFNGILDE